MTRTIRLLISAVDHSVIANILQVPLDRASVAGTDGAIVT